MSKKPQHHFPPKATKKPRQFVVHGDARHDEYAWLQDTKSPAVRHHIGLENEFSDAYLHPTQKLQNSLYREIRARMTEDDMSVPIQRGNYSYYTRTKKGRQYAIHCRRKGTRGVEEVILDENILARGKTFFALGAFELSPDHRYLAYSADTQGNERYTLQIKDLSTGKLLPEHIASADGVAWSADSQHIFYAKEQHPFPPREIYRHVLGTAQTSDVLVYRELDPQWYVTVSESADRTHILIQAGNFDTNECWYIPSASPTSTPTLVTPRRKKIRYSVEHAGDHFYMLTNHRAVNFKILRAAGTVSPKTRWDEWLSHDVRRSITGFFPFATFTAVSIREQGSEELYVTTGTANARWKIPLPEDAHTISVNTALEYDSPFVQFQYQSFVTPRTVIDYAPATKKSIVRKRQRVPGWNATPYTVERVWARSGNVRVPISLVYPTRAKNRGPIPFLMEFYGSYGYTNDPHFSITRISLLSRGWGIAIAHPRGGGEMGWTWHKAAHKTTKHRTYADVIAAADHLVHEGYTTHELLSLTGGSAGGMTLGAVLNIRPDVCSSALCYVPDADVVTSSLDTTLGGTLLHYDELGDPRNKNEYLYMKRWSPYENVREVAYPTLLVRASLHDIRTPFWEAAKWVSRLRDRGSGGPILLKVETHAGHAGKSGRYEWVRERAYDYAFLLQALARRQKSGN